MRASSFLQISSRVLNFSIFRLFVVVISILDTRQDFCINILSFHQLVRKLKVFSLRIIRRFLNFLYFFFALFFFFFFCLIITHPTKVNRKVHR